MKKPILLNLIGIILIASGIMSVVGQNLILNILRIQRIYTEDNALFITALYSITALVSIISGYLLFKGNRLGEWLYLFYVPISIFIGIIKIGFTPMAISSGITCILIYFLLNTKEINKYMNDLKSNNKDKQIQSSKYKLIGMFLYGISLLIMTSGILLLFKSIAKTQLPELSDSMILVLGIVINYVSVIYLKINKLFINGVTFIVIGSLILINSVTFSLLERMNNEVIILLKYILAASLGCLFLFLGRIKVLKSKKALDIASNN